MGTETDPWRIIDAVIEWSAARKECLLKVPVEPAAYDRLARAEAALQAVTHVTMQRDAAL